MCLLLASIDFGVASSHLSSVCFETFAKAFKAHTLWNVTLNIPGAYLGGGVIGRVFDRKSHFLPYFHHSIKYPPTPLQNPDYSATLHTLSCDWDLNRIRKSFACTHQAISAPIIDSIDANFLDSQTIYVDTGKFPKCPTLLPTSSFPARHTAFLLYQAREC